MNTTERNGAMTGVRIGAALAVAALAGSAAAQVHDSSFKGPDGARVLQEWVDIDGPAACVWKSLTDESAIKAQGLAMAHVELKNGGVLEEGFTAHPKREEMIRHQIIAYLPERLLVLRNLSTPPGLPGAELYPNIVQVISLEPRDGGVTRFTISHTGYGQGEGYDKLYAFFRNGNGGYLMGAKKACEAPAAK
jgi:hypothetical protein